MEKLDAPKFAPCPQCGLYYRYLERDRLKRCRCDSCLHLFKVGETQGRSPALSLRDTTNRAETSQRPSPIPMYLGAHSPILDRNRRGPNKITRRGLGCGWAIAGAFVLAPLASAGGDVGQGICSVAIVIYFVWFLNGINERLEEPRPRCTRCGNQLVRTQHHWVIEGQEETLCPHCNATLRRKQSRSLYGS